MEVVSVEIFVRNDESAHLSLYITLVSLAAVFSQQTDVSADASASNFFEEKVWGVKKKKVVFENDTGTTGVIEGWRFSTVLRPGGFGAVWGCELEWISSLTFVSFPALPTKIGARMPEPWSWFPSLCKLRELSRGRSARTGKNGSAVCYPGKICSAGGVWTRARTTDFFLLRALSGVDKYPPDCVDPPPLLSSTLTTSSYSNRCSCQGVELARYNCCAAHYNFFGQIINNIKSGSFFPIVDNSLVLREIFPVFYFSNARFFYTYLISVDFFSFIVGDSGDSDDSKFPENDYGVMSWPSRKEWFLYLSRPCPPRQPTPYYVELLYGAETELTVRYLELIIVAMQPTGTVLPCDLVLHFTHHLINHFASISAYFHSWLDSPSGGRRVQCLRIFSVRLRLFFCLRALLLLLLRCCNQSGATTCLMLGKIRAGRLDEDLYFFLSVSTWESFSKWKLYTTLRKQNLKSVRVTSSECILTYIVFTPTRMESSSDEYNSVSEGHNNDLDWDNFFPYVEFCDSGSEDEPPTDDARAGTPH